VNQLGTHKNVCDIREYGYVEVCLRRDSTVPASDSDKEDDKLSR